MPQADSSESLPVTEFSTARAMVPLKVIAQAPHYFGSPEHEKVGVFFIGPRLFDGRRSTTTGL